MPDGPEDSGEPDEEENPWLDEPTDPDPPSVTRAPEPPDPWLTDQGSWGDDPWTEEPAPDECEPAHPPTGAPPAESTMELAGAAEDSGTALASPASLAPPGAPTIAPPADPRRALIDEDAPRTPRADRPATEPVRAAGQEPASSWGRTFRPELQGLRAMAILMVVVYHVWFGRVSGGVDVFLLISAFFLTGTFMRRIESGAPLAIPRYWLRAFTRLMPPGATVITATVLAGIVVFPLSRIRSLLDDAIASALYVENWLLGARSVDYYAVDHSAASPLQHFWSLAIQGQMFLLMPLLFGAVALISRRTRLRAMPLAAAVLGAITVASLAYAVLRIESDQALAYFDTGARVWEFALGALLALALPRLERRHSAAPSALRAALGWVGVVLILACGWVIDVEGVFPGPLALWPLGAACLAVLAGRSGTAWGADRLLSSVPLQWLGNISFALYLIHWPLLVLVLHVRGETAADLPLGAVIIAVSILLAWVLTISVDSPIRRSSWIARRSWRGAVAIALSGALVLGAVAGARALSDQRSRVIPGSSASASPGSDQHPGAGILLPGASSPASDGSYGAAPIPALIDIRFDTVQWRGDCPSSIAGQAGDLAQYCTVVPTGADDDAPLVIIAGNSHALQAQPMIQQLAAERGWRLISVARPQCSFGAASASTWCAQYNQDVVALLQANGAAGLITYATFAGEPGRSAEQPPDGFEPLVAQVLAAGIPVLGLRDVPRLEEDFVGCAERGGDCSSPVSASLAPEVLSSSVADAVNARLGAAPGPARLTAVDLTPFICPGGTCVPQIGNVYTYLDDNHLTAAYAESMGAALIREVDASGFAVHGSPGPGAATDGGGAVYNGGRTTSDGGG